MKDLIFDSVLNAESRLKRAKFDLDGNLAEADFSQKEIEHVFESAQRLLELFEEAQIEADVADIIRALKGAMVTKEACPTLYVPCRFKSKRGGGQSNQGHVFVQFRSRAIHKSLNQVSPLNVSGGANGVKSTTGPPSGLVQAQRGLRMLLMRYSPPSVLKIF